MATLVEQKDYVRQVIEEWKTQIRGQIYSEVDNPEGILTGNPDKYF